MIRRVTVEFSGATEGEKIAWAFVVYVNGKAVGWRRAYDAVPASLLSVQSAHFAAVFYALTWLVANKMTNDHVRFYCDDMNVVNCLTGRWTPKDVGSREPYRMAVERGKLMVDVSFTCFERTCNRARAIVEGSPLSGESFGVSLVEAKNGR